MFDSNYGMVFVAINEPITNGPTLRVSSDVTFANGDIAVMPTRSNSPLFVDNSLDVVQFPFVHAATFGADEVILDSLRRKSTNSRIERTTQ